MIETRRIELEQGVTAEVFKFLLQLRLSTVPDNAIITIPICGCCDLAFPVEHLVARWEREPTSEELKTQFRVRQLREGLEEKDTYL